MCSPTRNDMHLVGAAGERDHEVFTDGALGILRMLHTKFDDRRRQLIAARAERDNGRDWDFSPETRSVREDGSWQVAGAGPGLEDRRVEITGPVDRKMTINALNSGANGWLADFEDASSPTWRNVVDGQLNLHDAISGVIEHEENGKHYRVSDEPTPTIIVRPRGLHLREEHVLIEGRPIAGALMDFGLFIHHNARRLIDAGKGPYFYLPKLESHLEARWWDEVFSCAERWLRLPHGTIRATVLIETLPAAFEMDEILHELRDHAAGLAAGRWDYIFSTIKKLGRDPEFVLPDRSDITMTVPFMRAYTELLVATCHRRGAHAIGGMAAVIPSRDPDANAIALAKVKADKEREAGDGYDGSRVAHPGLVETCHAAFAEALGDRPNQVDRRRDDVLGRGSGPGATQNAIAAADLLAVAKTPGAVTAEGLRSNVSVLVRYADAWLEGRGAVAIDGLMEDAATAEISRCQLWQRIQHGTRLTDGGIVTAFGVAALLEQELADLTRSQDRDAERIDALRDIVRHGALGKQLPDFFTADAYSRHVVEIPSVVG